MPCQCQINRRGWRRTQSACNSTRPVFDWLRKFTMAPLAAGMPQSESSNSEQFCKLRMVAAATFIRTRNKENKLFQLRNSSTHDFVFESATNFLQTRVMRAASFAEINGSVADYKPRPSWLIDCAETQIPPRLSCTRNRVSGMVSEWPVADELK